ncbi:Oidioi.mRNA.OKI2018_I69.PAR.g11971.t1.cds [Oikopleura dioica]|uniref:Oidioi.mRNA.OKI2018_I69.PAR.g11971.t1.cds n=1 Tax=Oikopleura dioica TaxID=34765 RepID=A0ABN7S5K5_OIKDI|nr:Oidioi.mRNA.OKI2018_I69.PAR.g11971.t1.cds [Oikopleura dioica]
MPEEKVVDAVAQDQIFKDYVKREKESVTQWVRAFDFMLSEESLKKAKGETKTAPERNPNVPATSAKAIGSRVGKNLDLWAGERRARGCILKSLKMPYEATV